MNNLHLSYAGHVSDRVQDLYDGKVRPEGIDLHYIPLQPVQAFNRMLRGEFHTGEMSFSTYVIKVAQRNLPFIAIPAFPARTFRHNNVYVNRRAGIMTPQQLKGRRVGVPEYQMTAAVWARGMLQHDYGVQPQDIHWVTGGLKEPGRRPMIDLAIKGVNIQHTPDHGLFELLQAGEIDALISPQVPPQVLAGHPDVGHLFPNHAEVERAYFGKTGIFPIMHVVVMRKEVYEEHPWAAVSLYQAFEQAKQNALERLAVEEPLPVSLPWLPDFARSVRSLMGEDYWPYGVEKNRKAIEALCDYTWEQGLVPRRVAIDELFAPSVVNLSQLKL